MSSKEVWYKELLTETKWAERYSVCVRERVSYHVAAPPVTCVNSINFHNQLVISAVLVLFRMYGFL